MRKRLLAPLFLSAAFLAACGGGDKKAEETKSEDHAAADNSMVKPQESGEELMNGSDCKTCHKPDTKLVGPSFKDIAAKYPLNDENVKMLADKIINGGSGNWGETPMAPHSNFTENDGKEIAKHILETYAAK
ncbi:cytochrome c [Chitinophaga skermanii]|uniref:Cytochrome c n=1 Tax=Chitinophaga skermanii TaxID=331697 RepID=A0A327R1L2_9BACT|nr:c-type cytochrome [Chitinophaga skermanii]RAJ10739.1 cytochrome c [Chitinophaga skermanii]